MTIFDAVLNKASLLIDKICHIKTLFEIAISYLASTITRSCVQGRCTRKNLR